ncbi:MAG: hypothetical protein KJ070_22770, partial [Verrucomicrobia bacterium]|nr:hypothetical protein [Verrucomicrobiota bacterium]
NYVIRKVTLTNGLITHVAGSPVGPTPFTRPERLALDQKGNIFVANDSATGSTVWRINGTNYSDVQLVVGGGAGDGQSGPPTNALINVSGPLDVAVDDHGGVYVGGVGRYWRADLRTQTIQVFAGLGSNPSTGSTFAGLDGPSREASLKYATALAVGPDSTVYLNNYDPNLMLSVSQNVVVDDPDSQSFVSGQTNLTGNLIVNGTTLTNLEACELALLQGNLSISSNANLLAFCLTNLDMVTGDLIVTGNTGPIAVDISDPNVGGDIVITGNTGASLVKVGDASVDGDVIVTGNTEVVEVTLTGPTVEGDVIVTGNTGATLVRMEDGSVGDNLIVTGNTGAAVVDLSGPSVGIDVIVTGNTDAVVVSIGETNVGRNVTVTGNTNVTELLMTNLTTVGGSITISDGTANTIAIEELQTVGDDLVFSNNPAASGICLSKLRSVGRRLYVGLNPVLTSVCLDSLTNVASDFVLADIADGTDNTITASELEDIGGDLVFTNNPAASELCLAALRTVGGDVTISNNAALAKLCLDSLTNVTGDFVVAGIADGTDNTIQLAETTTVGGDVLVDVSGPTNLDLSGVRSSRNVSITADGAESVSAQTGGSNTVVSITTASATVSVQLTNGTFETNVTFTIQELAPAALPAEGSTLSAAPVAVAPLAAYQFNFAVPTLNADATLSFTVTVAALADPAAFLAALDAGRVTFAVVNDTPGSPLHVFDVCGPGQSPMPDTCVRITRFDVNGDPLPAGSPVTPTTVRVDGVVGHFSSYAVVTFQPLGELTITGPEASDGAFSFSFASQAGTNYTVQFTDSLQPVNWQTLTNLSGNGGLLQVSDAPLTNAHRFYRVKIP